MNPIKESFLKSFPTVLQRPDVIQDERYLKFCAWLKLFEDVEIVRKEPESIVARIQKAWLENYASKYYKIPVSGVAVSFEMLEQLKEYLIQRRFEGSKDDFYAGIYLVIPGTDKIYLVLPGTDKEVRVYANEYEFGDEIKFII